ncbi:hypothetical protein [Allomesorhizobium camelthorni]|uniref:Uncharacterized protein n=1 Tax=Allomesorhizobium camelthorni TaxID=475069 RepID=A0A6G4WA59_9HYPH|nr:hypothetical protein [Mesorhizobium camelthorni]NGO51665.1 hypothetical protein [Mesorhizobium camelthorni]
MIGACALRPWFFLYGIFTPRHRLRNSALTHAGAICRADVHQRNRLMFDLIYIALATGGFLAFAAAVRACERL